MTPYVTTVVQVWARFFMAIWLLCLAIQNPVHWVLAALFLVDAVCSKYYIKHAEKAPPDSEIIERITQNAQKQIIDKKLPTYGRMIMFVALVELEHHKEGLTYTDLMNKVYYNTGASLRDIPIYVKHMKACKYISGDLRAYTGVYITYEGKAQLREWLQEGREQTR